jgi:hypothetical protein
VFFLEFSAKGYVSETTIIRVFSPTWIRQFQQLSLRVYKQCKDYRLTISYMICKKPWCPDPGFVKVVEDLNSHLGFGIAI